MAIIILLRNMCSHIHFHILIPIHFRLINFIRISLLINSFHRQAIEGCRKGQLITLTHLLQILRLLLDWADQPQLTFPHPCLALLI